MIFSTSVKLVSWITLCLFLCSFSCTNTTISDPGGGLDVGNPTRVSVVDANQRPVANALVRCIDLEQWYNRALNNQTFIVDSAFTDAFEDCYFDSLAKSNYSLQVDHCSGAAFIDTFNVADTEKVQFVQLKQHALLTGAIDCVDNIPSEIRLVGTAYSAIVAPDGRYFIANVAEGTFSTLVLSKNGLWSFSDKIALISGSMVNSDVNVSFKNVLIDDFDSATVKLKDYCESSSIYTSTLGDAYATASYRIVPEGYGGGNALKVNLQQIPPATNWSIVGFNLGTKSQLIRTWNFSTATGISFDIKGRGRVHVTIESDSLEKIGYYYQFGSYLTIPDQWSHIILLFDSLKLEGANAPALLWKDVSKSIKRIEFNINQLDSVAFWIDNLSIEGADFKAIYYDSN